MRNVLRIAALVAAFAISLSGRSWADSKILDDYDGAGGLTYASEGVWDVAGGVYEAKTGGLNSPEHGYVS